MFSKLIRQYQFIKNGFMLYLEVLVSAAEKGVQQFCVIVTPQWLRLVVELVTITPRILLITFFTVQQLTNSLESVIYVSCCILSIAQIVNKEKSFLSTLYDVMTKLAIALLVNTFL